MRQRALTDGHAVDSGVYVIAILGLLYLVTILAQLPGGSLRGDFSIYYACALAMHRGLDPYAINLTDFTRELGFEPDPFAHPADTPTFTLITEPLSLLSPAAAYAIWFVASVVCLAGSLYLLFGPSAKLDRRMTMLLALGALGFTPLADNVRWAQSQVFAMFGVLLFLRLMQRRRDVAAGVLLAALGLLRGFPLVLGGYLIVQRRWRAIAALAIAFTAGGVMTVAAVGIGPVENFLRVIGVLGGHRWLSLDPRWEVAAANVSLDAFVARPLMVLFGAELSRPSLLLHRAIVLGFQIAILGYTFSATAKTTDDPRGRRLSLWVATMLMLSPVVWLHYLVLLMVPLGMIAVAAVHRETNAPIWRFAIVSYCFVVLVTPLMSTLTFRKDIFDWATSALAELGFLALLSTWIAAYRFASEPFSESSDMGVRPEEPARS